MVGIVGVGAEMVGQGGGMDKNANVKKRDRTV